MARILDSSGEEFKKRTQTPRASMTLQKPTSSSSSSGGLSLQRGRLYGTTTACKTWRGERAHAGSEQNDAGVGGGSGPRSTTGRPERDTKRPTAGRPRQRGGRLTPSSSPYLPPPSPPPYSQALVHEREMEGSAGEKAGHKQSTRVPFPRHFRKRKERKTPFFLPHPFSPRPLTLAVLAGQKQ